VGGFPKRSGMCVQGATRVTAGRTTTNNARHSMKRLEWMTALKDKAVLEKDWKDVTELLGVIT